MTICHCDNNDNDNSTNIDKKNPFHWFPWDSYFAIGLIYFLFPSVKKLWNNHTSIYAFKSIVYIVLWTQLKEFLQLTMLAIWQSIKAACFICVSVYGILFLRFLVQLRWTFNERRRQSPIKCMCRCANKPRQFIAEPISFASHFPRYKLASSSLFSIEYRKHSKRYGYRWILRILWKSINIYAVRLQNQWTKDNDIIKDTHTHTHISPWVTRQKDASCEMAMAVVESGSHS